MAGVKLVYLSVVFLSLSLLEHLLIFMIGPAEGWGCMCSPERVASHGEIHVDAIATEPLEERRKKKKN